MSKRQKTTNNSSNQTNVYSSILNGEVSSLNTSYTQNVTVKVNNIIKTYEQILLVPPQVERQNGYRN